MTNEITKIEIDVPDLNIIKREADKIFLTPRAEKFLVEFMKHKQLIEEVDQFIKSRLQERAEEELPNFTSIYGDDIRVTNRAYGAKYLMEKGFESKVPKYYKKVKKTVSLDPQKVEKLIEKEGGLPFWLRRNDRVKKISFNFKKSKDEDEE